MLQFPLMQSMANYLKSYYNNRFSFSIFTNGTLISDEVIDFFINNNVFVTLSMDGSKDTQDLNRRLKNNQGTFQILEPILKKLVTHHIPLRIRMTVTPNNCNRLFENIEHFVDKYGIMDIQEEIDRFIYWDEDKIDILIGQYQKIIDYIVEGYIKNQNFSWKNYEKRVHPFIDQSGRIKGARCGC